MKRRRFYPKTIQRVRQRHAEGVGLRALARELGVAKTTMTRILRGLTYKDVPGANEAGGR